MRHVKDQERIEARQTDDQYDNWVTPVWATAAILPMIQARRNGSWIIIDPGCGCGDVSIVAGKSGMPIRYVQGIEIHEVRADICREAYDAQIPDIPHGVQVGDWVSPRSADKLRLWASEFHATTLVIGNPPFSKPRETIGLEFVEQAIQVAAPRGIVAFLLPLDFASGVDRATRLHDKFRASCYPLRRRPSFGTAGPSKNGKRPVAWFVFDLASRNRGVFQVL